MITMTIWKWTIQRLTIQRLGLLALALLIQAQAQAQGRAVRELQGVVFHLDEGGESDLGI